VPANSASDRSAGRAGRAVRVQLTVHGGMDLRLTTPSANARHRRVPSHEALSQMAAQHRTPVPPPKPAGITPAPRSVIEVTGEQTQQCVELAIPVVLVLSVGYH